MPLLPDGCDWEVKRGAVLADRHVVGGMMVAVLVEADLLNRRGLFLLSSMLSAEVVKDLLHKQLTSGSITTPFYSFLSQFAARLCRTTF